MWTTSILREWLAALAAVPWRGAACRAIQCVRVCSPPRGEGPPLGDLRVWCAVLSPIAAATNMVDSSGFTTRAVQAKQRAAEHARGARKGEGVNSHQSNKLRKLYRCVQCNSASLDHGVDMCCYGASGHSPLGLEKRKRASGRCRVLCSNRKAATDGGSPAAAGAVTRRRGDPPRVFPCVWRVVGGGGERRFSTFMRRVGRHGGGESNGGNCGKGG
eukprot:gene7498-biopygen21050